MVSCRRSLPARDLELDDWTVALLAVLPRCLPLPRFCWISWIWLLRRRLFSFVGWIRLRLVEAVIIFGV